LRGEISRFVAHLLQQGRRSRRHGRQRAEEMKAMGLSERQAPRSASSPAMTGNIMRSIHTATSAVKEQAVAADEARLPKLRVLFVTEDDPIYVIRFFDIFFAEYPREALEICGITIDRAFHEQIWKTLGRMHGFYGLWGTFRQGLRFIDARLRGRSIASLARSVGVPLVPARSVNQPEYIDLVSAMAPDVIVSVAAPEIFKSELLEVPRLCCINIHSGRLPMYRGMMPTFWQMLRGERAATITVHRMAEKLDAGDVLATHDFAIKTFDSLDRVIQGTKCEGARLVIRVLLDLRAGRTQPSPLDMIGAKYFSFPKPQHVQEFRKRGHKLL
jgi:methionyl-tRNA formyltransferase